MADPVGDAVVFPTPVGVFLTMNFCPWVMPCLPHARGGVSGCCQSRAKSRLSSPRPWGCFHVGDFIRIIEGVFPTPVGVFLTHQAH